ncbi:MAG: translocation/assembly module TamB domain-containing protein [Elusimicrobiota bacterium]
MKARTVLRPLAGALLILIGTPVLLLTALLAAPQRFLTSRSVGRAIRVFGRAYRPRWNRFDFAMSSESVFEKKISASASGFCFAKADGSVSACFKRIEARFSVSLAPTGARVTRIAVLEVDGDTARIDETKGPARPAEGSADFDPFNLPRLLPGPLRGVKIEKLRVDLPSVEVARASGTTLGTLSLDFDSARAAPLAIDARWEDRGGGPSRRSRARLSVASDLFEKGQLTRADASGSFVSTGITAEFAAHARQAGFDSVALDLTASGRSGAWEFDFSGRGLQSPDRCALSGALGVEKSSGPFRSLRLDPFELTASPRKGRALPAALRLNARLAAEPAGFRPVRGFTPPRVVFGRLTLNARATPSARQPDHFDADLSILLQPYMSWYEAHVDLFARASGRLSDLPRARLDERLDANANIPRFEDLVAFLADGAFAVPAPISALKGGLTASFPARGDHRSDRLDFDYRARADLAGEKQKLKLHVTGGGSASRITSDFRVINASAAATLDDVALQLPHLDALKLPTVTLDSRIKSKREREAERAAEERERRTKVGGSSATIAVELTVGTTRPILLYTDLAKTPVPVALDLRFARPPGAATGAVEVKSFDVEFFRRGASVDHLTLTLRPGSRVAAVDGLIKYQATEALISIRLLGTTDKPQVVFESDPPMSQSDIVAMLVYGKSPDELDADEATTVSNSQTAMSSEAFGLASLYLFASTPVQYVGYDPATQSYTLKVRIPGGETLSVKSDFDTSRSVELRKRLSRHLAIVGEAVNSPTQGNGIVTMLEWFTRY